MAEHPEEWNLRMTTGGNGAANGDCLDAIALAELAEGRSSDARRAAHVAHLGECAHCRRELASIVELLSAPDVAGELARHDEVAVSERRRGLRRAIPLIAAVALIAVVLPQLRVSRPVPLVHRESPIGAQNAPALLAPIGDVRELRDLRWTPLAAADLYRVTVYQASGRVLYEADIRNTTVALPDSVAIVPGRSNLWKVEARTGIERWTSSEMSEFRLIRGRSP